MARSADVTVPIPSVLRHYCGGAEKLTVEASNVRAALGELERREPSLYTCICDETGAVRRHINVFVNNDHMRDLEGLDTRLKAGDVLTILPSVSGG